MFVCILPEKVIPEMTYTVSGGTLNPTHSLALFNWRHLQHFSLSLQRWKNWFHQALLLGFKNAQKCIGFCPGSLRCFFHPLAGFQSGEKGEYFCGKRRGMREKEGIGLARFLLILACLRLYSTSSEMKTVELLFSECGLRFRNCGSSCNTHISSVAFVRCIRCMWLCVHRAGCGLLFVFCLALFYMRTHPHTENLSGGVFIAGRLHLVVLLVCSFTKSLGFLFCLFSVHTICVCI